MIFKPERFGEPNDLLTPKEAAEIAQIILDHWIDSYPVPAGSITPISKRYWQMLRAMVAELEIQNIELKNALTASKTEETK